MTTTTTAMAMPMAAPRLNPGSMEVSVGDEVGAPVSEVAVGLVVPSPICTSSTSIHSLVSNAFSNRTTYSVSSSTMGLTNNSSLSTVSGGWMTWDQVILADHSILNNSCTELTFCRCRGCTPLSFPLSSALPSSTVTSTCRSIKSCPVTETLASWASIGYTSGSNIRSSLWKSCKWKDVCWLNNATSVRLNSLVRPEK